MFDQDQYSGPDWARSDWVRNDAPHWSQPLEDKFAYSRHFHGDLFNALSEHPRWTYNGVMFRGAIEMRRCEVRGGEVDLAIEVCVTEALIERKAVYLAKAAPILAGENELEWRVKLGTPLVAEGGGTPHGGAEPPLQLLWTVRRVDDVVTDLMLLGGVVSMYFLPVSPSGQQAGASASDEPSAPRVFRRDASDPQNGSLTLIEPAAQRLATGREVREVAAADAASLGIGPEFSLPGLLARAAETSERASGDDPDTPTSSGSRGCRRLRFSEGPDAERLSV